MRRSFRHLALGVLLVPALAGAAARPTHRPGASAGPGLEVVPRTPTGPGHVTFVTADAVYLDRGKQDGLHPGATVTVLRGTRVVGACKVTDLSDSSAMCTGVGMKAGDRVDTDRKAPPPAPTLDPLPTPTEMQRRRDVMEARPWELAAAEAGQNERAAAVGVTVALTHQGFVDFGSARPAYNLERLDVAVADFKARRDLVLGLDASLLWWASRSKVPRSPLGTVALLLRQAQVVWKPAGAPVVVRAGRLRPRGLPGMFALDGVQAGYLSATGQVEAGLYGGLLPGSVDLSFDPSSYAAGVYGSARLESGKGAEALLFQADARAGWTVRPALHGRFEVGVSAHAWLKKVADVHLLALLSSGSPEAPQVVDSVSLNLGLHPTDALRLRLDARYRGNTVLESQPVGVVFPASRAVHSGVDVAYDLLPGLTVSARAGLAKDIDGTSEQYWVGPEVSAGQLFGGRLALSLGYQEELGGLRGRSVAGTVRVVPSSRLRLAARAAWASQTVPGALAASDVGLGLSGDVRLTSAVWVRAGANWRTNLLRGEGVAEGGLLPQSLVTYTLGVGIDL